MIIGLNKPQSVLCVCCVVGVLCHALRFYFLVNILKDINKIYKITLLPTKFLLETGKFDQI